MIDTIRTVKVSKKNPRKSYLNNSRKYKVPNDAVNGKKAAIISGPHTIHQQNDYYLCKIEGKSVYFYIHLSNISQ